MKKGSEIGGSGPLPGTGRETTANGPEQAGKYRILQQDGRLVLRVGFAERKRAGVARKTGQYPLPVHRGKAFQHHDGIFHRLAGVFHHRYQLYALFYFRTLFQCRLPSA